MNTQIHPRASQLFSILAYDAEDGLFLTEDRSLAFGFICQPLSGADSAVDDRLNVLLNQDWSVDTLLQVSLWTSPDIDATMALMQARRIAQQQEFHKDMLRATVEFLGQGAQSALDGTTGIRLRRMQVLVTVKLPMAGAMPTESDIHRAAELRLSTFQSLGTIGLRPETLGSDHYVRLLSTMLNWSPDAGWHDQILPECDPALLIRDQLFDFDKSLRVDARGLWLGDKRVKTLSFKRYPDRIPRLGAGLPGRCDVRDAGHTPERAFDPDPALPPTRRASAQRWTPNGNGWSTKPTAQS